MDGLFQEQKDMRDLLHVYVNAPEMDVANRLRRSLVGLVLFVSSLYLSCARAEVPPASLQFIRLLTDQGVSVGSVEVIHQDHLGYMWFGGADGLIQYDGYNYVIYRNVPNDPKSLSSNIVWDIHEDKQGEIWIATDMGLCRFNRDVGNFIIYQHDNNNPNSLAIDTTRSITEDSTGSLWIATTNGLSQLNPERNAFTNYRYNPNDSNSLASNELRRVYVDRSGTTLWIGQYSRGLNRFDIKTGKFTRYPFSVSDGTGLNSISVINMFQDGDGFLWLGSDGGGLNRLDPVTGKFTYYLADANNPRGLSSNIVTGITDDPQGNLWIATEWGLNYFDRKAEQFIHYLNNPTEKYSLGSSNVHSVFMDSNHDLWVGNFPAGVNFLDTSNMVFRTYRNDPTNPNSLSNNSVLAIDENPEGIIWLGTDGGGLNRFDLERETFTHYQHDPENATSISDGAVLSLQHARDGKLWLGTWHGGLNSLDLVTGRARHYRSNPAEGMLSNENVWALATDNQQNLWVGTIGGGLDLLKSGSDTLINYQKEAPTNAGFYVVWKVFLDHKGQLWIGANEGLGRYVPEKDHFVFYHHDDNDPASLSFDVVLDIAEDKNHQLWIATRGGGLNRFDPVSETFTHYRVKDGLPDDVVRSVQLDDLGNLWLGSASGLTQFNPETEKFITYDERNGLQGNLFNFSSALKTHSGEMIFGGTGGFTIFDPAKLKANKVVPPVAIVDFQIFNKPVVVGESGSPLTKTISQTDTITLGYQQTVFSFSFVAMSYRNPEKNQFAYIMEGFEKNWNYVGFDRRNATYTNLNPGTYVFRVKAANNEGLWNDTGRSITLHILPPPWKTWWAYTLYGLLIIGLLRWFVYQQRKQVVFLEAKVSERTAELQSKHHELEQAYAQLEAISLSDPLTGLNNRRYLQKLIPMDVVKIQREYMGDDTMTSRKPSLDFTFLLLDIDFFKQVNDTYGHMAGDQILIQLSLLLTSICRESDCLVRWGGEEFLIVSRFASRDEAPLMAERIRHCVEQHQFILADGKILQKTCSIGFACYPFLKNHPQALSWEQVIDIADRALYAAKKSGRNCSVGLASTESTSPEHLYEKLSLDLKSMIEQQELRVISSLHENLIWD